VNDKEHAEFVARLQQTIDISRIHAEQLIKIATMIDVLERSTRDGQRDRANILASQKTIEDMLRLLMSEGADGLPAKLAEAVTDAYTEAHAATTTQLQKYIRREMTIVWLKIVGSFGVIVAILEFIRGLVGG